MTASVPSECRHVFNAEFDLYASCTDSELRCQIFEDSKRIIKEENTKMVHITLN
jgi:hypothetical protein